MKKSPTEKAFATRQRARECQQDGERLPQSLIPLPPPFFPYSFYSLATGPVKLTPASCVCVARNHSYTWLNSRLEPTEIPAHEYMSLMQRWISGKIDDAKLFPTDPSTVSFAPSPASVSTTAISVPEAEDWTGRRSGFPKEFASTCRTVFLQMFRVYAHLYWSHYEDPFYHLNLEKQLNSCFSHFLLTATSLDMLRAEDLEPVQLLINLWAANGTFPPESKTYAFANVKLGEKLMQCEQVA